MTITGYFILDIRILFQNFSNGLNSILYTFLFNETSDCQQSEFTICFWFT